MKVIIAGSRQIKDFGAIVDAMLDAAHYGIFAAEVVSGAASGVDQLGERWADQAGVPIKRFPAYWKTHGKRAGPIRNKQMAEYGNALVAIWDGESKGTRHMIEAAKAAGMPILIFKVRHGLKVGEEFVPSQPEKAAGRVN